MSLLDELKKLKSGGISKLYVNNDLILQVPSGSKNITSNGNNIDVKNFEKVNVAVASFISNASMNDISNLNTVTDTISIPLSGHQKYIVTIVRSRDGFNDGFMSFSGVTIYNHVQQQIYYNGVHTLICGPGTLIAKAGSRWNDQWGWQCYSVVAID